ncbi:MAG: RluA family pseudouridine synthase [Candidatus Paceibacterota bacterium]|jgi:23S rRNA pseudouridine1911/1915/1917 synthase
MSIDIIYEDENILVINKSSGVVIHPFDYSNESTILDFLSEYCLEIFSFENNKVLQDDRIINLGGIVHKLDRDTSGILVVAKNEKTYHKLKEQFKNHTIKKTYVALVEGIIEKDSFTIDAPLGRSKKDYKQSTNPMNPRGELRDAVTDVEVITRGTNTTLVKLYPKTGRTHQLRAHMASIGHPIVGDKAYGSKIDSSRIMLHAKEITFILNNKELTFEAETPKEFFKN